MNQDEYQKKIDEHRQSIGAEEDSLELRSSRRAKSTKPQKKKRKNVLAPTLFFIFILIPVCILIYVQFFYSPTVEEAEQVDQEIIQVETKPISNSNDEEIEVPKEAEEEPAKIEVEETTEKEPVVVKPEEKIVEEPKVEPKVEVVQKKTHIVKTGENLYRIAINYYNDPAAVEKIRAANGLSSNEISVGQTLTLP